MADQVIPEVDKPNSQSNHQSAYACIMDSMRVRNALSSVSNGIPPPQKGISLSPVPATSTEPSLSQSLKKLGRKSKESPIAMITKPVQTPVHVPVNVFVKNRFKHTKPGSHVIGNSEKNKNALDIIGDSYCDAEEGPPAKQSRTEESTSLPTPRSVIISQHAQLQQQTVTKPSLVSSKSSLVSPSLVTKQNINTVNLLKPPISLCPSCHSKDTTHISNGTFKCKACSRTYVTLNNFKTISTSASNLIPAAAFYNTPRGALTQPSAMLKNSIAHYSAPAKITRAKKPAETIDLVSSDDEDDDDDESDTQENATSVTAPIANNTPLRPTMTSTGNTATNNLIANRLADRMHLKGGEGSARNNNPQTQGQVPLPVRQQTPAPTLNEYMFHCNKVMFGELHGHSLAPTKVVENRMYLSLECLIVRDNVQASEKYTLSVGSNDVEQMYVYFGRVPSFVAIETAKKFASVACKRIGKEVLVPRSEEPRKRYILLALNSAFKNDNEADSERRNLITAVSPWANINVLSHADATHLIAQSGLDVNQKEICYGRTSKALGPVETLFIYPPSLKSGGIPITTLDVACLDEGTYLNDVIIDFYLKYICESIMTSKQRKKTYIFNSYFYKRLTQKASTKLDPATVHSQVKKWTRGVDIFEKDYIIIPINEHCHWYLAIICFHGQPLLPLDLNEREEEEEDEEVPNEDFVMKETTMEESEPNQELKANSTAETKEVSREENITEEPNGRTITVNTIQNFTKESETKNEPVNTEQQQGKLCPIQQTSVQSENQPQQQHLQTDPTPQQDPISQQNPISQQDPISQQNPISQQDPISQQNPISQQDPTPQQDPISQQNSISQKDPISKEKTKEEVRQANDLDEFYRPCILIFDSLIGSGHSRVFTNLRNYLTQEWISRKPTEEAKVYDKDSMKGCYPKIPRQNNDCDCGVFLLQYSEFFFSKPIRNFKLPIHLEKWFTVDSVTKKRDDIKALIAKLAEENKQIVRTTDKKQKSKNKKNL